MVSKLIYVNHRAFLRLASRLHDAYPDITIQNIKLCPFQTWVKFYFEMIFGVFFKTCLEHQIDLIVFVSGILLVTKA